MKNKGNTMSWKSPMKSYKFLFRFKSNGKTMSFTDHLHTTDKTKSWYITSVMKKYFDWDTVDVVRVSQDVSGLGRNFKMVYSESKGWVGENLTKNNPYI